MKTFSQKLLEAYEQVPHNKHSDKVNQRFITFFLNQIKKQIKDVKVIRQGEFDLNKNDEIETGYLTISFDRDQLFSDSMRDKLVKFGFKKASETDSVYKMFQYILSVIADDKDTAIYTHAGVMLDKFKNKTDFYICEFSHKDEGNDVIFYLDFTTEDEYMHRRNYD